MVLFLFGSVDAEKYLCYTKSHYLFFIQDYITRNFLSPWKFHGQSGADLHGSKHTVSRCHLCLLTSITENVSRKVFPNLKLYFKQALCSSFARWLVGWLVVRFYGISTFVGYLMPNPFLYK